jgi:hypothetical protein
MQQPDFEALMRTVRRNQRALALHLQTHIAEFRLFARSAADPNVRAQYDIKAGLIEQLHDECMDTADMIDVMLKRFAVTGWDASFAGSMDLLAARIRATEAEIDSWRRE